jgi:hypothetical protein
LENLTIKNFDGIVLVVNSYKVRRLQAIRNLGNSCIVCGERCILVLEIDHKEGDGKIDRGKQYQILTLLSQGIELERFQLLCANCHTIKTKLERSFKKKITLDQIRQTRLKYADKEKFIKPIFERPLERPLPEAIVNSINRSNLK